MSDNYASEVTRSLNRQDYMNRADITSRVATGDEPGRSDLLVLKNKRGTCVEIKSGTSSFLFSNWRDNQREWMTQWCHSRGVDYWLWLILGTAPPIREYSKIPAKITHEQKYPRQSWIVPDYEFTALEQLIHDYSGQKTLPYLATKGYNKELQENNIDAYHKLASRRLQWRPSKDGKPGYWHIPSNHIFHLFFIS